MGAAKKMTTTLRDVRTVTNGKQALVKPKKTTP
jgi:hypothetical protein